MSEVAGVRVRVLGPFEIEDVDRRSLGSRKTRTLLKVLALARGQPVPVDRLVDRLWGGDLPQRPEREVSVHVSRARKVLGARLQRVERGYALDIDWLDLAVVDALATDAAQRLQAGNHAGAHTAALGALALVRGPLLADEPDTDWLELERSAVRRTVSGLRRTAAEAALAVGEHGDAASLAEAVLDEDPYDEAALRLLMRAHHRAGRPGSALAAYTRVRDRLVEDLGVGPTAETERLHDAVLLEEPSRRLDEPAAPTSAAPSGVRADLLHALDNVHRAARNGFEIALLEGEPGIGKTWLLDAWAARAQRDGTTVLRARCDELGRDLPLQPLADAVASFLHGRDDTDVQAILAEDADTLATVLGHAPAALHAMPVHADELRLHVFTALLRVLERCAARARRAGAPPLALLIDDVHLAGPSTLAWLTFAQRRGAHVSMLVVLARRPGEGLALPSSTTLDVGPLDRSDVEALVGRERADVLLDRSGGNPLLLVELARSEGPELPGSMLEAVEGRLQRVGDAAPTLRTAAILGPSIDLDLLARVLDESPLVVLDHLETGVRHAFLDERGNRFVFRHELVREALAATTSGSRRVVVHRTAAEAIAARPGANALDVAYHARMAGLVPLAADALAGAGEIAAQRYDFDEASRLLDESMALAETGRARLARARLHLARGNLDDARDDARAAQRLGVGAEALEVRAWVARNSHQHEEAIELGEHGARLALSPVTRASCLLAAGWARRGRGDLVEAERALAALAELERDAELGPLSAWLGMLYVHTGRPRQGLPLVEPATDTSTIVGHGFLVEHALQFTAHAFIQLGRSADALDVLDVFERTVERLGTEWRYRGLVDNYRSHVLRRLGDPSSDDVSRAVLDRNELIEISVQARLDVVDGLLLARRSDDARRELDVADRIAAQEGFNNRWRCEHRSLLLRARLELDGGSPAAAADAAEALVAAAGTRGERRYLTLARVALAWARARSGGPVDLAALHADLDALDEVAGLESWWWRAKLATATGVDAWTAIARDRAVWTADRAGARRDGFLAHARAVIDGL